MNIKHISLIVIIVLSTMSLCTLADEVYSYADETGEIHFSNSPSDDQFVLLISDPPPETQPLQARSGPVTWLLPYHDIVAASAQRHGLDEALIHAVIDVESRRNPNALSSKGAIGLMQLMPATAKRYGANNPWDPAENIRAGTAHLKWLLGLFNNNMELALAAYNAGEKSVTNHGNTVPPYQETRAYIPKVIKLYRHYSQCPQNSCMPQ